MELDGGAVSPDALAALSLYNYGHFTSMLVERGRVRGLPLHLDRLRRDCRALFDTTLDMDHVRKLVRRACGPAPTVARVTVFAPDLDLSRPGQLLNPRLLVTTRPAAGPLPPVRLHLMSYQRELPAVKHAGLFGTVWHRRQAQLAGFDDVAFVDGEDRIIEGATWNIGFIRGGEVIWPLGECLQGVTMRLLKGLSGVKWHERAVDMGSAEMMEGAFITNAAVGVRAIAAIDGTQFAVDNPVVSAVRDAYQEIPGEEL